MRWKILALFASGGLLLLCSIYWVLSSQREVSERSIVPVSEFVRSSKVAQEDLQEQLTNAAADFQSENVRDPVGDGMSDERKYSAGASILTIVVRDEAGLLVTHGRLRCSWKPRGRSSAQSYSEQVMAQIQGAETVVELPYLTCDVQLDVIAPGWSPGRFKVSNLRRPSKGVWKAESEISHKRVEVVISRSRKGDWLRGRILVDGTPRIPAGLSIVATSTPHRNIEAFVLEASAEYLIHVESGTLRSVLARSDETSPLLIEAPAPDAPGDLSLTSCEPLGVVVLDRVTKSAVVGATVACTNRLLEGKATESGRSQKMFVVVDASAKTDERGLAVIGGVARIGDAYVSVTSSEGILQYKAKHDLAGVSEGSGPLVVLVGGGTEPVRVWGEVAELATDGGALNGGSAKGLRVCFAASNSDASSPSVARVEDGIWHFRARTGDTYGVWAERDGVRITEVSNILAADAGDDIHVTLRRLETVESRLTWTGAQTGSELTVTVSSAAGAIFQSQLSSVEPVGVMLIGAEPRSSVGATFRTRLGSTFMEQATLDHKVPNRIELSLATVESLQLAVDGMSLSGRATLLMQSPCDSTSAGRVGFARIPLLDGASIEPISLTSGVYVCRYAQDGLDGLVVGLFEVPSRPRSQILINWAVKRESMAASDSARAVKSVTVRRLAGVALADCIAKQITTIEIPTVGSRAASQAGLWLPRSDCEVEFGR
jgi:hypothetical protein